MISKAIEESRIRKALRGCKERGLEVLDPMDLIRKAINDLGDNLSISCSFGKCSTAVLHMTLKIKSDIKIIFNNTGVQFKETYQFRDFLVKEWDLNYYETKPLKSFWECIEKYGLPQFRNSKTRKPKCCLYLKELPAKNMCKELGVIGQLTGLRVAESRMRMMGISQWGQYYFTKAFNIWRFHPIAFWTTEQLEKYIEENEIPVSEVYTKLHQERNGCMPCTGYRGWRKQMKRANPRLFNYVNKLYEHEQGQSVFDDFDLEEQALEGCKQVIPTLEEWF